MNGVNGSSEIGMPHDYPVGVAEVKSKRLRDAVPPKYFRVEIDGRCQIDLAASNIQVVGICPECHRVIDRTGYPYVYSYQMVFGSWDGCALFRDVDLYPRVSFCTQAVLELAAKYRFTNFRFERMDEPPDPTSRGIQYLPKHR